MPDTQAGQPAGPHEEHDGLPSTTGVYAPRCFESRLATNPNRDSVWRHICVEPLDPAPSTRSSSSGPGGATFKHVAARRVVAMDLDETVEQAAAAGVAAVVGECTDLVMFDDDSFDVVFASNLLEHLERPAASRLLAEVHKMLRTRGRLVLVQLNFRLNPGEYFDDHTHVAI